MKKIKYLIVILTIVLFIILWMFPVKKSIKIEEFDISSYATDNVAVLCHGENSTDVEFVIINSAGISYCPKYIKYLTGKTPEKFLKRQIDDNYDDVNFLLIGNFNEKIIDPNESYVFDVQDWYVVGDIKRRFNLIYYPKYGFNLFECKLKALTQWE